MAGDGSPAGELAGGRLLCGVVSPAFRGRDTARYGRLHDPGCAHQGRRAFADVVSWDMHRGRKAAVVVKHRKERRFSFTLRPLGRTYPARHQTTKAGAGIEAK